MIVPDWRRRRAASSRFASHRARRTRARGAARARIAPRIATRDASTSGTSWTSTRGACRRCVGARRRLTMALTPFDVDRARSWTSVARATARDDGARRARGARREGEDDARREARGAASFARADNTSHHNASQRNASAVDDEGAARGSHAGDDGESDVAGDRGVWRRARCATWARRRGWR